MGNVEREVRKDLRENVYGNKKCKCMLNGSME